MAVYRQIQISFWQDPFILDLTPEEKYFYLYLMTNSKTKQCGVYELPKKIMELETGYNRETIEKLLNRFIEYRKVEYCDRTKEIVIRNWLRYNTSKSPQVRKCIETEVQQIKHEPFRKGAMDTLSILYGYCMDTVWIDSGEEEEKEEEKEEALKTTTAAVNLFKIFEQEFGRLLSPMEAQEVLAMEKESGPELTKEALRRAVANRVLKTSYIQGILNRWSNESLTTLAAVLDYEQTEKKAKTPRKQQGQAPKTNEFGEDKFAGIYAKG